MKTIHLALVSCFFFVVPAEGYKRVCYYSNWSQYRPGSGKFFPTDIDPGLCTHLIYSFAKLDENHELATYEWNDLELYKQFNGLKAGTNIKTLLAVGGWNAGSEIFSIMVSSKNLREKFARKAVDFLVQNDFDGLDMDWEYPANRGGEATDKANFIILLEDIRKAMKDAGQSHLLLTAAVSAGKTTIDSAYDIPGMTRTLDFINLMSYDLHGGWERFTGHNSPLYSRSTENSEQAKLNVDWAAEYWVKQGTPRSKLIIGLPTYGRHFTLSDSSNHEMGAPTSGSGIQGPMTREAGFLAYYEICDMLVSGAESYWHAEHKVPYLVNGNQWVGYDDERSFIIKLEYIKDKSYGGAMIWNIDLDDFNQQCSLSNRKYPLMSLMKEVLDEGYTPTTNIPTTGVTTPQSVETVTPIVTDTTGTIQTGGPTNPPAGYKRVCYYSNWSQYRPGSGKFFPTDIDPGLCTHLIYSFAKLDENHELATYEWNDLELYKDFNGLKAGTNIKTLLAVGGWNAGSEIFSIMVSSKNLREKFARKAVDFLVQNDFDGLDMDWEYPANRGGAVTDKINFITLLEDIRKAMKDAGQSHLLLTAAVSAGQTTIDSAYDIPGMTRTLDFINLMSYDLHGGWDRFTGHNSPLYSRSTENSEQAKLNVDWAAEYWVKKGTPRSKLIIGLPTYGRHFTLSDSSNHEMGAPTSGSGIQGPMTREAGFLAYYEVCDMLVSGAESYWHAEHKVPYLVKGNQWVGYDDERSFKIKLEYIKDKSYGGAMIWNIDLDDFNQQCSLSNRKYPLMSLMKEILGDYTPPTTNNPATVVTTDRTDKTVGPTNPPGEFTCNGKTDGFYGDPINCSVYYYCGHGTQYNYECPNGLFWNPLYTYCDYPENVNCVLTTLPPTTEATTNPLTTQNPTEPPTTENQTEPPTTENPTEPPTTENPTEPPTTENPTEPSTTENPTEPSTTENPTELSTTENPTEPPTTENPTELSTTENPTELSTTENPTEPPTTENPTEPPTTEQTTKATTNPPTNFCANKRSGLYKKMDDCQSYYYCSHGTTHIKKCFPGTLYNAETKSCDWEANVDCDKQDPDEFCGGKAAGLYAYPDDCSKYYNCAGTSSTVILTCTGGTYYSVTRKYCDWPANVDCGMRPKTGGDSGEEEDFCAANGNGFHVDPDSCHNYIQCANGVEYPGTCGVNLAFNPNLGVCDWPENVGC